MRASTLASMLFSRSFCSITPWTCARNASPSLRRRLDGVFDLVVRDGIDVLKRQVFEFAANLAHAQAVRDGRVDFLGLARDLDLPLGREVLQRAHVVQPVGQLDHDHADVVHHGQHHLADALGLRLFARGEIDFADLGDALDDVRDLLAELAANVVDRDRRCLRWSRAAGRRQWPWCRAACRPAPKRLRADERGRARPEARVWP